MNTEKAIDIIDNLIGMVDDNQDSDYDTAFHMAIDALKAQAERTEERTETHACDCIERQAAIDALKRKMVSIPTAGEKDLMGDVNRIRAEDISVIRRLPSAQPNNSCDGCRYENADDGVLVPCGFCKRSHPDNYERRTDEQTD